MYPISNGSNFLLKGLTMASELAITIPKTTKVKLLLSDKKNLEKNGYNISSSELFDKFNRVELIDEIIVNEMIGSKNKYLVDLEQSKEDNK